MHFLATLSFVVGTTKHDVINWTTVIELFSSLAGLAALGWGIFKGYEGWKKLRAKKRQAEEDVEIEKKIQAVVEVSLTKILTKVDDAIHATVADSLADINERLGVLDQQVGEVHNETHNNGGSSMKDSQDRTEGYVIQLLENQAANQQLFIAAEKRLDSVVGVVNANGESIATLQQDFSKHIGAHEGLPE
jgi:hypothetical protein